MYKNLNKDEKLALILKIVSWTQKNGIDLFSLTKQQLVMALSNK